MTNVDPTPLVIIVRPHIKSNGKRHPNLFDARLEGESETLCESNQPFVDSARILLNRGHDPGTILVMRHASSDVVALRGALGTAAKLTVDEHNGTVFARWKPFPSSAGSARIADFAARLSETTPKTATRRERGRPRELRGRPPAIPKRWAKPGHASTPGNQ
jgi:hypothetical protein